MSDRKLRHSTRGNSSAGSRSAQMLFSLWLVLLLGAPRHASAEITCAVIPSSEFELADSPLVDLLEVRLSGEPELVLLNRSEIDRVLAEKALSLSLSSSREARCQAGALLRAELLALMAAQQTDEGKIIELCVVETKHGLRLSQDQIVWNGRDERAAELIGDRILQMARRARAQIRAVVAVPPFASGDLLFDFDHLKHTYARLVERATLQVPGTITVDLDHAREIAEELALSEGEAGVRRGLPLYLIGEYRNTGRSRSRRVELRLTLRHGDRIVASAEAANSKPEAAAEFLRDRTIQMLTEHLESRASPPSQATTRLEADLLEEHARAARLLGHWEDAIRLAEACLLLDPGRAPLHFHIFESCAPLATTSWMNFSPKSTSPEALTRDRPRARRGRQYALLGLEHLERYLHDHHYGEVEAEVMDRYWDASAIHVYPDWSTDLYNISGLQREVCRMKVEVIAYILENDRLLPGMDAGAQQKTLARLARTANLCVARFDQLFVNELGENKLFTARQHLDLWRRMIEAFGRHAEGFNGQCYLISGILDYAVAHPGAFAELMAELRKAEGHSTRLVPEFSELVLSIQRTHRKSNGWSEYYLKRSERQALARELNALLTRAYAHRPVTFGDLSCVRQIMLQRFGVRPPKAYRPVPILRFGQVTLEPITLLPPDGEPFKHEALLYWGGWLACGEACDAIWGIEQATYSKGNVGVLIEGYEQRRPLRLYLMHRPGELQPIPRHDGRPWNAIADVKWDGRYVWVACRDGDESVFVVDPARDEIVAAFGSADGLPPATLGVALAPVSAGRVCVAGCFGRTWIANLAFDDSNEKDARKSVDVFHEAREFLAPMMDDRALRRNVQLAFTPLYANDIRDAETGELRVFVRRSLLEDESGRGRHDFDLILVDPERRRVQPVPHAWPKGQQLLVMKDRVLLIDQEVKVACCCDFEPRSLIRLQPEGLPWSHHTASAFHEGVVHCLKGSYEWFSFDPDAPKLLRSKMQLAEPIKVERHDGAVLPPPGLAISSHYGLVAYSWDGGIFRVRFLPEGRTGGDRDRGGDGDRGLGEPRPSAGHPPAHRP